MRAMDFEREEQSKIADGVVTCMLPLNRPIVVLPIKRILKKD